MRLAELLDALDYTAFPQYYLKTDREHSPDIAPLFRSAKDAGVDGIYVVQSSPQDKNILPVRPAVYVAEAQTPEQAREIHRALWNLGQAPYPSCGSGVFLVLAYRRLIEMELAGSLEKNLPIAKLLDLLKYVYGVERELDACYVTEFSLILTLLNYANVAELLSEKKLLPPLHNKTIFHADFFDNGLPLWEHHFRFDWIVGNPPWIQADSQKDQWAFAWIEAHKMEQPVSKRNVAEAFTWRVLELLNPDGCIGLILPAASLYNLGSRKYRQSFFQTCEVFRITNFSNLRQQVS